MNGISDEIRGWAAGGEHVPAHLAAPRKSLGKAILKLDSRVLDINLKRATHTEVCILILGLHNISNWTVTSMYQIGSKTLT
jgi:hypothetical protein